MDNSVIHLFPSDDLVHPHYSPSVFVSGFSWNNGPFQMANLVDKIEHGADIIAHIGSLQFDRRNALRLRYRLLPEQTTWTPERNLDISLGKLPWGNHTLEVQARLFTGPWSGTAAKSFTVLKPLWLQWPSLLGFAFAGGFAAAGGFRWQRKRRRRAETDLPGLADWRLTVLTPETGQLEGAVLDGRFEVGRILARGGFATVFEGRDLHNGQPCAVKIFRHELTEKSWMARRFQQEVSALQQIHHPNVVAIYGHGNAPSGAPYLAMELIAGKTLRDILSQTKLDHAQVANYLRQTGSALAEIHARQICHRDLKPENLMIRDQGIPGEDLVLIDFSIAIVQDADETLHGLSRAAGTLQYMAPEQAVGYADASSDIYSLAKILLEMLTGQRLSVLLPDASLDLPARIHDLLTQTPYGLSASSIDLIAQALEFDPSRRPKNVSDFTTRIAANWQTL
jgi:tRNA A-37 threonylcarbamoyl transferase component Bud32